jgi:hypothetical protein
MDREGALGALRRALSLGAGAEGGEIHELIARALAIEPIVAR